MKKESVSGGKRGSHALSDSVLMSIKQQGCRVTAEAKARGKKEALSPMTGNVPRKPLAALPRMWKRGTQAPGLPLRCELTKELQGPGDPLPCSENSHTEKTSFHPPHKEVLERGRKKCEEIDK